MTYVSLVRHLAPAALLAALASACNAPKEAPPKAVSAELAPYVLDVVPTDVSERTLIDFESKVQLVAYDLDPQGQVAQGSTATLRLYWRALERLPPPDAKGREWRLFTELLDRRGHPLVGGKITDQGVLRRSDGSGRPALPPSEWQPGKIYVDEQTVTIPRPLLTETVLFSVGFERAWTYPARPADAGAGGAAGKDEAARSPRPADGTGGVPPTVERELRLRVVSGPSDGQDRGIVASRPTDLDPKQLEALRRARREGRTPGAASAQPPRQLPPGFRPRQPGAPGPFGSGRVRRPPPLPEP